MKASDIILSFRTMVNDLVTEQFRFSDALLLLWVNDGGRELVLARPDAFYTATEIIIQDYADVTLGEVMGLPDKFKSALASYLLYRYHLHEKRAAKAGAYLQEFHGKLR